MAAIGVSWTSATTPGIGELDAALDALEVQAEVVQQAAHRRPEDGRPLVAEELAEMELLALAERLRGLLAQLLREDNRVALAQAVDALCARLSRLGALIQAVALSQERASDTRWADLDQARAVMEAVLRDMYTRRVREYVELHDRKVQDLPMLSSTEDLALNHFLSMSGGSLTISDASAMSCSSRDMGTDDLQNFAERQHREKSLCGDVAGDAGIAASGPERTDSECSTASTAASSLTLPEMELTMRLTGGMQEAATDFNVSSCAAGDQQQRELTEAQQRATQWFDLSMAAESDGEYDEEHVPGREEEEEEEEEEDGGEDQSWFSPCMATEQYGIQDQPLLISLVDSDACCSSACADSGLAEVSFRLVSPHLKHGPIGQQQQQQQRQELEQQRELQHQHEGSKEAWPEVTAEGVSDHCACAATAGGGPKEGAPADEGVQPLVTRFSLARARHEVCVDFMHRVAERTQSLEEENEHLKAAGERLQQENVGLMQELLRLREEADQWRLLQSTSLQSPARQRLGNSPCLDAWRQPLEAGLNVGSVQSQPPADENCTPKGLGGDGTGVGSLMAEIWLDAPLDASYGEKYPARRCGEFSPASSRAACCANAEGVQVRHSVGSGARAHAGTRVRRDQEMAQSQQQQQQQKQRQRASSGVCAAAFSAKAPARKVAGPPGGVLGRLAAMQRARDSEAKRERAALRIQRAVRALILRPVSHAGHSCQTSTATLNEQARGSHAAPHVRVDLQRLRREQATYAGGQPVARPLQSPRRSLGSDSSASTTSCQTRPPLLQSKPQDTSRARRMPPWAPSSRRPREAVAARQAGAKQAGAACSGVEEHTVPMRRSASVGPQGLAVEFHEKSVVTPCAAPTRRSLPHVQVGRSTQVPCRQRPLQDRSSTVHRGRFILVGSVDDQSAGT